MIKSKVVLFTELWFCIVLKARCLAFNFFFSFDSLCRDTLSYVSFAALLTACMHSITSFERSVFFSETYSLLSYVATLLLCFMPPQSTPVFLNKKVLDGRIYIYSNEFTQNV